MTRFIPETTPNVFTPEQSERAMKIIMGVDTDKTKPSQRRALDALKDICDEVIDAALANDNGTHQ